MPVCVYTLTVLFSSHQYDGLAKLQRNFDKVTGVYTFF
jgi:hypothetical protein